MNFLRTFEDRVSGIFGAAKAPFSFKKLAKQAAREMEDQTLVINGVSTAPALFTILISNDDDPLMAPLYPQLSREVSDFVKAQAEKKGYTFVGEPLVRFMIDPSLKGGRFSVFAENVDAPTLGRLYEEEKAYQAGLQQGAQNAGAQNVPLAGSHARQEGYAGYQPAASAADPFAPAPADPAAPIPVPQTVARDAIGTVGGASAGAAVGSVAGMAAGVAGSAATSVASNMVGSHAAQQAVQSFAQIVDVVTGTTYDITSTRCTIGRERAAVDIALSDPNISRRHVELTYTGSGWSLEDLNSTNGTQVNNRRVSRCPLRNGDLITLGLSTFEFRS